jgi:hypothetical protein
MVTRHTKVVPVTNPARPHNVAEAAATGVRKMPMFRAAPAKCLSATAKNSQYSWVGARLVVVGYVQHGIGIS